jgi:hypothetical protein
MGLKTLRRPYDSDKKLNKRSEQLKDFKTDSFEWLLEKYTQTSLRDFLEKEGYFTGITKLIDERIKDLNL